MNDQVVSSIADNTTSINSDCPEVAILLCTHEGQAYLPEQLESIFNQTVQSWRVWASDDQSQDTTHAILKNYLSKWGAGRLTIRTGPRKGCAANFLSLICCDKIRADYYAYSDQDDIWETDKLERALAWFKTLPDNKPALYCSRTRLVNVNNQEIGLSPLFQKSPGFANALMQNIGGGNTMILNHAARVLMAEISLKVDVVLHDWWTYLVISGCGGEVFYDPYPALRYRQHACNLVGNKMGWFSRFERVCKLWHGQWKDWNDKHIAAISKMSSQLTPENRKIFDHFRTARKQWLIPRIAGFKRAGIYRQTLLGNLSLVAAVIFNKL